MKTETLIDPAAACQKIFASLDLDVLTENMMEVVCGQFPVSDACALFLCGQDQDDPVPYKLHVPAGGSLRDEDAASVCTLLAGRIPADGRAVFSENQDKVSGRTASADTASPGGSCAVALLSHEKTRLGIFVVYTAKKNVFNANDRAVFLDICRMFSTALSHSLSYEKAAGRAKRFLGISRAITVSRHLSAIDEVIRDIAKVMVQSLGFDHAWVGLVNDDQRGITGKTGFGRLIRKKRITVSYSFTHDADMPAVQACITQKPVISARGSHKQVPADFNSWLNRIEARSYGFVPILKGEQILGVIGAFLTQEQIFNNEDVKTLVSIAEQAAIAIENSQLYEQIKKSEENYRALFESAGTCLAIINSRFDIILVNKAFLALSGCAYGNLVGKKKFSDFFDSGDCRQIDPVKELSKDQNSWEGAFITSAGDVRQVHFTTASIPDSGHTLVSLIDMTRERELERRLFRSEELASIGELSAGIAHEIRNPLVAITTSVSLLKDEPQISEDGRELLDVVKEESDHLAVIVNDFLRFARPQEPNFREANINKLVADVIRKTTDLPERNIEIRADFADIPMVAVDRHQIQQVITNLIINGLDACGEEGALSISSRLTRNAGTHYVQICIADNGKGISPENINKIFQPFFSTKDKGTGMGLAICQRIIDAHDGEISVESNEGGGTVFTVVFPVRKEDLKKK